MIGYQGPLGATQGQPRRRVPTGGLPSLLTSSRNSCDRALRTAGWSAEDRIAYIANPTEPDPTPECQLFRQMEYQAQANLDASIDDLLEKQRALVTPTEPENQSARYTYATVRMYLSLAGLGLGVYHGYRRSGGMAAVGWGLFGSLIPEIIIPVAFAQGLGKRK